VERFSIWLILAGLIMAGLATIAYVIDVAGRRRRAGMARVVGTRSLSALGDKCLRSQPRQLHRGGTEQPDTFRAGHRRSLVDGLGWR
jgi:hypothetical protein